MINYARHIELKLAKWFRVKHEAAQFYSKVFCSEMLCAIPPWRYSKAILFLGNQFQVALPGQEVTTRWSPEFFSNLSQILILWFLLAVFWSLLGGRISGWFFILSIWLTEWWRNQIIISFEFIFIYVCCY